MRLKELAEPMANQVFPLILIGKIATHFTACFKNRLPRLHHIFLQDRAVLVLAAERDDLRVRC